MPGSDPPPGTGATREGPIKARGPDVREAGPADAARLAELMTDLGYPTSLGAMERRLDRIFGRDDFRTFLLESSGGVSGMAGVQLCPTYERDGAVARLVAFIIDPGSRRLGLGAVLLGQVESLLRSEGISRIVVNSATHRQDAHAFYTRLGYEMTGVRFVKVLS